MGVRYLAGLVVVLAVTLIGCGRRTEVFNGAPVILVTIDTLRSDHLPAYGYSGGETPCLDRFAEESVLYERAYAHAPLTLPSHASMLTGTLPPYHGVRDNFGFRLADDQVTLAEALKENGYRTGAVVSSMVMRKSTGIAQGFDFFDDDIKRGQRQGIVNYAERIGVDSLAVAESWLDKQKGDRFFLWLHLYDPHFPYSAPAPYGNAEHPYDGEISYADSLVGKLFDKLKHMGVYDEAVIVVASDHGEGLGDHGELQHGMLVYREALQVPLMIRFPGGAFRANRIIDPVALGDLAPTLCVSTGTPSIGDGLVLPPLGDARGDRMIFSESINAQLNFGWDAQKSVIVDRMHYIDGAGERLFDLIQDPAERENLIGQTDPPDQVRDFVGEIGSGALAQSEVSQEEAALLQSLGYVGGFESDTSAQGLSEERFLQIFNLVGECNLRLNRGEYADVEQLLSPVVQRFPAMLDARLALGAALFNQGKLERAEALHLESLAMSPQNLTTLVALVETKLALDKPDEAKTLVRKAVDIAPTLAPHQLLPVLNQYNLYPMASTVAQGILKIEPDYVFAHAVLARGAALRGAFDEAQGHLDDAHRHLSSHTSGQVRATIAYVEGDLALRQDQPDMAIEHLLNAIEAYPQHGPARSTLSWVYFMLGRPDEAIDNLDTWLEAFPSPYNLELAARTCDDVGRNQDAQRYRRRAKMLSGN